MPTPITKKGYDALKAELDRLRKVERPQVIEAIAEARAHGDLSENAEYDAAKERQGFIESRIAEIETKLADARVVEIAGRSSDTVVFGATVCVIEQESQDKRQYTLVGQDEADMKFNRISIQSPVGRALIGKRVGDFIEVKTPVKIVEYEVVEIDRDWFVASMKGVILSINPQATIIDLNHRIGSHDIQDGAYVWKSCYRYFPDGTVHVAVVDPGVGTDRRPLSRKATWKSARSKTNNIDWRPKAIHSTAGTSLRLPPRG
jgi:transcription elongation factor GreA